MLRPVGPLPAWTYWVRRSLVLGCLALLLLAGAWVARHGVRSRGHQIPAAQRASSSPTAARTALFAGAASPSPSTATSPSPSPSRSRPAPPKPCAPAALAVVATTDAAVYQPGVSPRLTATLLNSGGRCLVDPAAVTLTVFSGPDRIWSSADCAVASHAPPVPIGANAAVTVPWPRQRSRPGCPSLTAAALPGTYRLYATLGSQQSSPAVFSLR